ncbi:MAG: hypothetical protein ACTSVZ_01520 [Promethearchaeota archaeon]
MSYSFIIVAEKFWIYLKQVYMELWNEMYTDERFLESICIPFLEDTPSGCISQFSGDMCKGNYAYDLI